MVTQNSTYDRYGPSHQCACNRNLILPPIVKSMEPYAGKSELKELQQLIGYIKQSSTNQQLPSIPSSNDSRSISSQWPTPSAKVKGQGSQLAEGAALQQFGTKYHAERTFSRLSHHDRFLELFSILIQNRLCSSEWMDRAPADGILRVLMCLRILMRDSTYQKRFFELGGVGQMAAYFERATSSYLYYGETPCMVDILKEMTNIFQKLSSVVEQQEGLVSCGAHKSLVLLLSSNDVVVLHCSLLALICLAQSPGPRRSIGELNCVEQLLTIIQDYDNVSKKHATRLLCLLCQDLQVKDAIKLHDGIPILLSQLVSDNANMLYQVIWCIANLCVDPEISMNVRQIGGIPLLLSLLHDRSFVSERNEASGCASASIHSRTNNQDEVFDFSSTNKSAKTKADEFMETQYKLKQACCTALAELVLNDTNAHQIAQANGVFTLGLLILPPSQECSHREKKASTLLQRFAFRSLRFLFSMERNRRLFKKLFPADLYTMFIDIGHYNRDLSAYKPLVQKINSLPSDIVDSIRENICEMNQNRTPTHYVKDYAVFEHLGRGAFGSVYKVRKRGGQTFVALKEIDMKNPAFVKPSGDRDKSIVDMISELQIMRQGIRHPNIVRYHKTFLEGSTLFIIMDLIEGAPLSDHFNSLKEKHDRFTEARTWNILIQMLLALRYLHKDKGIVHRDLTPNNIMLGENDKVTITDFGLAKVKGTDTSKMTSQCGTILYSCPEMVEGAPYTEKADVWALGCIIYQMCVLDPPFFNTNMLTLVKNIVEGVYKPIPDGLYSDRLVGIVKSCICPNADRRPDTVELASGMSDLVLRHMDTLQQTQSNLQRKLDRERRKTQKHFVEANQCMQKYHRLFVSPEHYDKLSNLGGSGGAVGFKEGLNDSAYDSQISPSVNSPEDTEQGGWTSDDDSCPSSEYESQSRESSAGSSRGGQGGVVRRNKTLSQLPPVPTPRAGSAGRDVYSQQLTVDIPHSSKISRDSGFGSGDPSPISVNSPASHEDTRRYLRSNSTPVAVNGRGKKAGKSKSANTLTISNRHVRQVNDPISQMLHTLHKIIYISQLPPTLNPNPKRRVIERFKRALFAPQSSSVNLKGELHKLNTGSRDVIDLNLGPFGERINSAGSDLSLGSGSRRGSTSSIGSTDGNWIGSAERNRAGSGGDRRQRSISQRRNGSVSRGKYSSVSSRESSSEKRIGSAGSDSDSSMSSTLKGTDTPRSLNSTLKAAETPRTMNIDLSVSNMDHDDSITYEQLQSMIETVLVECGYYSTAKESREKTPPMAFFLSESIRSRLS
ncbi:serine/threonine-protein kinase Nek10-like isoform X2 [Mya arenaria]|uniref:serine/threonine-protein kinase Nek10-like isoform X2 n=1 Tax=Mya arenaria TaxID=6604 RepID=UPI0022E0C806|nr:serine/threonine-protein kinase Nek10-like isoform X2 [Mya arenaria]